MIAVQLSKGSKISLIKPDGKVVQKVCVGLNWGAIQTKTFFGLLTSSKEVDLDGSAAIFDEHRKLIDTVYFKNLRSKDGAIKHSGDDLVGDEKGDDQKDNEVITIDFTLINPQAVSIVLFLNSYHKQDFSNIPYSKIQIYEGTPQQVDQVLATFNLSSDQGFAGYISMIMGKFIKEGQAWVFEAIGEATKTSRVFDTVEMVQSRYL